MQADCTKEKKANRGFGLSRLSTILSLTAGFALTVFALYLCVNDNRSIQQGRSDETYSRVGYDIYQELERADTPIGILHQYTFSLEEGLARDTHLIFFTVHQYARVYLDGERIYSLEPSRDNYISRTVGSNWVVIPLYREDAGKELQIEITPVYKSLRDKEVEFWIGSPLGIYREQLSKDLPQLILGIMAVFVGLVFVCVSGHSMLKRGKGKDLLALGIFSVVVGVWRLSDVRFINFMLPDKPVLLSCIAVSMVMLGIVPLIKSMKGGFHQRNCRVLDSYCIVAALVCFAQLLIHILWDIEIRDTLFITHLVVAVGACVVIGSVLFERIKYSEERLAWKKLPVICVMGGLADLSVFYFKGASSEQMFTLLAFLSYIVFMGISTILNYSEQEMQLIKKDRMLAEKERRLTENRITATMSQIRTHFLFNILTAISGYCKYDAKKADDALIRFSRYLRRNINIIECDASIDFPKELEYLDDYVSLEQMRFGDSITFKQEIEEQNFKIPPLILQPIVENAIKHGFVAHEKSGTITLRTKREGKNVMITITDDGVGFVPEECDKEESVGIKNVRFRLENMANGSLMIHSSPGNGTTATIRLPIGGGVNVVTSRKGGKNASNLCGQ